MRGDFPSVLAGVFGLLLQPVFAQTAPGDPAGSQTIPEKDQSRPQDIPRGEKDGVGSGRSGSLSNKLNASDGVIKPTPGIDPGIVKPAPVPNPHSTPVIPPPGAPGGLPGPEPK